MKMIVFRSLLFFYGGIAPGDSQRAANPVPQANRLK
jgi:hypothetical protein